MIILTKQQMVSILRHICTPSTAHDTVQRIKSVGVMIDDTMFLRYTSGIYYIEAVRSTQGIYHVSVDGTLYTTQSTLAGALAYADKLCQLLFAAKEVTVTKGVECIVKWVRIPQRINQWVQRYK